ncbi:MAG: lamin tail domain-containing protein, partial [Verrucomicrobiales bacterium]|nr:lamin tail domain-containing protein [Verrucomicrobiales bacterium]
LNGTEIHRTGMPAGSITSDTLATPANGEASLLGPVSVPVSNAVAGTNRLSVEVHQESAGSPDIVFGLDLGITYGTPALPFRRSTEQWVELLNRGTSTVDLSGWSFAEGLSYQFPQGTTLGPGAHLVVARDPAGLLKKHPGIDALGPFGGKLARDGEDIRLRDADNNPADEVRYFDSGRWPGTADGGGSSLELRDPDADNNIAESWAASDSSSHTTWQNYSYTGTAAASRVGPDNQWREFVFGLLTAGEVLVDDLSLIEEGTTQLIGNGDFESGTEGFRLIGNHRHGSVIPDPDNPANNVLRIVATGPTEHMHNHIETNLIGPRRVTNGREYTISFRARWVSGSPQLHTRVYFNRLPKTTIVATPSRSGTPGAPNTTATPNAGPTYTNLNHSPAVPAPGAPVTVSVEATDPDGVAALTLFYSVASGGFASVPMTASARTYTASLLGQAASSVVQFYILAEDELGASEFFPAAGPDSRAAYKVDDGRAATSGAHNIRIVMTSGDRDFFYRVTNVMSNDRMPCTVIVNE